MLHLIGMALQEEKQHLENVTEEHIVTFTFTQKISSMCTLFIKLIQDISDFKYVIYIQCQRGSRLGGHYHCEGCKCLVMFCTPETNI